MKSFYHLLRFASCLAMAGVFYPVLSQTPAADPALIPLPAQWAKGNGQFVLPNPVTLQIPAGDSLGLIADHIRSKIEMSTGYAVQVQTGNGAAIRLAINKKTDVAMGKEGYNLLVDAKG
ncbi:MAG TPA: glycoside hydrolase family 20 zincin-like fold domain-containing protein, partial [Flavihumibacter sp.]|nr:glycoside hydrolase family 20 zincin-like fold domain-containing protein [Flavihumibacter sp.]